MTWQEGFLLFTAAVNAVAACLAWVAKIRWSKEYRDATDRIIQAKEQEIGALKRQIELYEQLNPKKLVEWYQAQKEMAEQYVESLKRQLEDARTAIHELETSGKEKEEKLRPAKDAEEALKKYVIDFERDLEKHKLPDLAYMVNSASYQQKLMETVNDLLEQSDTTMSFENDSTFSIKKRNKDSSE